MISTEDITHLAQLARIEISGAEKENLTTEIDSILGYVSVIKDTSGESERVIPPLRNVMREDVVEHTPRQYTEAILKNAPAREGDYLKVKKIL